MNDQNFIFFILERIRKNKCLFKCKRGCPKKFYCTTSLDGIIAYESTDEHVHKVETYYLPTSTIEAVTECLQKNQNKPSQIQKVLEEKNLPLISKTQLYNLKARKSLKQNSNEVSFKPFKISADHSSVCSKETQKRKIGSSKAKGLTSQPNEFNSENGYFFESESDLSDSPRNETHSKKLKINEHASSNGNGSAQVSTTDRYLEACGLETIKRNGYFNCVKEENIFFNGALL